VSFLKQIIVKYWLAFRARKFFLPVLVMAGFAFLFVILMASRPETKPVEPTQRIWSVTAQTVTRGAIQPSVEAFGELASRREVNLRVLVAGEVISTSDKFEEGARVEAGEELLRLDPFNFDNALKDARAQLRGGQALLDERRASLELAKVEFQRAETLIQKGTVAQKYVDDRRLELTIAKSRFTQQDAAVDRLKVQVARAERDLKNSVLRAPFSGYLSGLNARKGRLVGLNDQVATLSDAESYEVRFNLSDAQYGRFLETGTELVGSVVDVIWSVGGREVKLKARLSQVGARISQDTRGVDAYAHIVGDIPASLRSGAFVRVLVRGSEINNVVSVKRDAFYGPNMLYVIQDGKLVARNVEIVAETDTAMIIGEGLADGELVLLTRFNEAAPEVAVKVFN
jgi:membrane fusion protein, multidrug efflux system